MERLGEYITEFASLLGAENKPVFAGVKNSSVGVLAKLPPGNEHLAHARITHAKHNPTSQPGRHLHRIQSMVDADQLGDAQLLDYHDNVVYLFPVRPMEVSDQITLQQTGTVDGIVTGMVGADDTMHLHLRDWMDRDLKVIVKEETMARAMLQHFRGPTIRVTVQGQWKRTDHGWVPENNKATALSFEKLDDTPLTEIFKQFAAVPDNGWRDMKDPQGFLIELRGDDE